jgi:hypothetical protein
MCTPKKSHHGQSCKHKKIGSPIHPDVRSLHANIFCNMSLPPLAVTILQADVADVPRLSAIAQAAFETDTHTRMKMLERDTTDMASELQDFAAYFAPGAAEKSIIIKAVDTATGEMVGFAGFSRWNYDGSHPAVRAQPPPYAHHAVLTRRAASCGRGGPARDQPYQGHGAGHGGRPPGRAHGIRDLRRPP